MPELVPEDISPLGRFNTVCQAVYEFEGAIDEQNLRELLRLVVTQGQACLRSGVPDGVLINVAGNWYIVLRFESLRLTRARVKPRLTEAIVLKPGPRVFGREEMLRGKD